MNLIITGIRGVPAAHGGFETFAENLAVFLVNKGWCVTVYCQESTNVHTETFETDWKGVRRVHIPVSGDGAKATVIFDFFSVLHASKQKGTVLTLGYNTAVFNLLFRFKGKNNLINMDGIEWKRDKWTWYERTWLYLNERAGCLFGNHLIADHPEIQNHLQTRVSLSKISMIPYGARCVDDSDVSVLSEYGLEPGRYALIIARPEPENSILEIVSAFSSRTRHITLVVLGVYSHSNSYQSMVLTASNDEVKFVGAVYDHAQLDALRHNSCFYIHGHTVGGTNPSLIEALGAGQAVLAHDNKFNRWVAGVGAAYFNGQEECDIQISRLLSNTVLLREMSEYSRSRYVECFTWDIVLQEYEDELLKWV